MLTASERTSWVDNNSSRTVVNYRQFEEVKSVLKLEDAYFIKGQKVLSVGEGFSNFTTVLEERYGLQTISLDPIYLMGDKVFGKTSYESQPIAENYFLGKVGIWLGSNEPFRKPACAVAGSIYESPFAADTFDKILGSWVFDQLNLQKAFLKW